MADQQRAVVFLKRRFARAIENGDYETAMRLRIELDLLMNGRLAQVERGDASTTSADAGEDPGTAEGGALEMDDCPVPELRLVAPARRGRSEPMLHGLDWLALES